MTKHYDAIIIGTGQAGPSLAARLTQAGMKTAIIERKRFGSIALDALGTTFVNFAASTGVSLEAMRRVTAVASGALDALPHNGAVITLLTVCGISHREAYGDIAVVAIVVPMISLVVIILCASLLGSF